MLAGAFFSISGIALAGCASAPHIAAEPAVVVQLSFPVEDSSVFMPDDFDPADCIEVPAPQLAALNGILVGENDSVPLVGGLFDETRQLWLVVGETVRPRAPGTTYQAPGPPTVM